MQKADKGAVHTAETLQQYRVSKAAAILGISEKTLHNWIGARKITVARLGRCVTISGAEIARLIEEGTTPAKIA
jgi:excisionase family DNA binding protein